MTRAFIFDCFGVLYHSSADELYSRCPVNLRDELHDIRLKRDRGYFDYSSYLQALAGLIDIPVDDVRGIVENFHTRNKKLFDALRSIDRTKYKIGMLSNIGDTTVTQLFSDEELATLFDSVVLSYRVGMVKPEPGIYRLMAERLGCSPEECIMIDDVESNCRGAEAVGMRSIHHVDTDSTLTLLHDETHKE